jgi:hypothetical protein
VRKANTVQCRRAARKPLPAADLGVFAGATVRRRVWHLPPACEICVDARLCRAQPASARKGAGSGRQRDGRRARCRDHARCAPAYAATLSARPPRRHPCAGTLISVTLKLPGEFSVEEPTRYIRWQGRFACAPGSRPTVAGRTSGEKESAMFNVRTAATASPGPKRATAIVAVCAVPRAVRRGGHLWSLRGAT